MVVGSATSLPVLVTSSVPQGSVLGASILFSLYINDLPDAILAIKDVSIKLFADDAKLWARSSDRQSLQLALNSVSDWASVWQMRLAPHKCSVMIVGKSPNPPSFVLLDNPIIVESLTRDLGIMLCPSLKSAEHCRLVRSKAMRRSGMLLRCFSTRNVDLLKRAFVSYVRPLLENATPVWSPYSVHDIDTIEKPQRFFTRVIFKRCHLSYTDYRDRLRQLGLETLELRRIRNDLVMYYKIMHGLTPMDPNVFFDLKTDERTRGHAYKIKVPMFKSVIGHQSFNARRVSTWNSLSENIVSANSVKEFVRLLNTSDTWINISV